MKKQLFRMLRVCVLILGMSICQTVVKAQLMAFAQNRPSGAENTPGKSEARKLKDVLNKYDR
jgi:hypothetical protein